MADTFSWFDTIKIVTSSCLPCLKPAAAVSTESLNNQVHHHNSIAHNIPRARPDELQGLLADPETLSLHSNPGTSPKYARRKKKRSDGSSDRNQKRITLFGYNLFGRRSTPPIHLPGDEDDLGTGLFPNSGSATTTVSTFDSDAAPLDPDTIAGLSTSPPAPSAADELQRSREVELQRQKEKEERRRKRHARRVSRALAAQSAEGGEFEGFQGSGDVHEDVVSSRSRVTNESGSTWSGSAEEYTPFVSTVQYATVGGPYMPSHSASHHGGRVQDDDDDTADLDGGIYTRRTSQRLGADGSDSHSRTSASISEIHQRFSNQQYDDQQYAHDAKNNTKPAQHGSPFDNLTQKAKKHKKRGSLSSGTKSTSSMLSQSRHTLNQPSIGRETNGTSSTMSPPPGTPKSLSPHDQVNQMPRVYGQSTETGLIPGRDLVSSSTLEQGLGFFDIEDIHDAKTQLSSFPSPGLGVGTGFPSTGLAGGWGNGDEVNEGFPSTGFSNRNTVGRTRSRDMGVFLARRGDEAGEQS